MASTTTAPLTHSSTAKATGIRWHPLLVQLSLAASAALIVWLSVYGLPYYHLGLAERVNSPLHPILKPSGSVGLRLGMLGTAMFAVLFLYSIRKRVPGLNKIGKTSHWLDFHIVAGISAPIIITFHASFKLGGLAGVAYWIMIAVFLSGIVGRYVYAQIPRSLNAAELSFRDMESMTSEWARQIDSQEMFAAAEFAPLLTMPSRAEIDAMSIGAVILKMFTADVKRPFQVARLRRRFLEGSARFTTLGGLLRSHNIDLELIISAVYRQSWLTAKMLWLERVKQLFHLWHIVHRPFSYSFLALVVVHIGVVLLLGYY